MVTARLVTAQMDSEQSLTSPPLVGSEWVTGSEERLANCSHRLWGPIEVLGKTYDPAQGVPPMTAFGPMLNDEELAGVLTYVRNAWGDELLR